VDIINYMKKSKGGVDQWDIVYSAGGIGIVPAVLEIYERSYNDEKITCAYISYNVDNVYWEC